MHMLVQAIFMATLASAIAPATAATYEDPFRTDPFEERWDSIEWRDQVKPEETVWYRRLTFKNIYVRNCYVVIEDDKTHTFYRYEGLHEAELMDTVKWQIMSDTSGQGVKLISVDYGLWDDYLDACGLPATMESHFEVQGRE